MARTAAMSILGMHGSSGSILQSRRSAREVEAARPPEASCAHLELEHAGEPIGAHRLRPRGARDEVPRARLEDEAERLELAPRHAAPALVADAEEPRLPHRPGHFAQEA